MVVVKHMTGTERWIKRAVNTARKMAARGEFGVHTTMLSGATFVRYIIRDAETQIVHLFKRKPAVYEFWTPGLFLQTYPSITPANDIPARAGFTGGGGGGYTSVEDVIWVNGVPTKPATAKPIHRTLTRVTVDDSIVIRPIHSTELLVTGARIVERDSGATNAIPSRFPTKPEKVHIKNYRHYGYSEGTNNVALAAQNVTWFPAAQDCHGVVMSAIGHADNDYSQAGCLSMFNHAYSGFAMDIGKDLGPTIVKPVKNKTVVHHSYPSYNGNTNIWARQAAVHVGYLNSDDKLPTVGNGFVVVTNTVNQFAIYPDLDYVNTLGETGALNLAIDKYQLVNPPYPEWVSYDPTKDDCVWHWRWSFNIGATKAVCTPFKGVVGTAHVVRQDGPVATRRPPDGFRGFIFPSLKDGTTIERDTSAPSSDYYDHQWTYNREDWPGIVEISLKVTGDSTAYSLETKCKRHDCSNYQGGLYFTGADYLAFDVVADVIAPENQPIHDLNVYNDAVPTLPKISKLTIPRGTLVTSHIEIRTYNGVQAQEYNARYTTQVLNAAPNPGGFTHPVNVNTKDVAAPPYEAWLVFSAWFEKENNLPNDFKEENRTEVRRILINRKVEPTKYVVEPPFNARLDATVDSNPPESINATLGNELKLFGNMLSTDLRTLSFGMWHVEQVGGLNDESYHSVTRVWIKNKLTFIRFTGADSSVDLPSETDEQKALLATVYSRVTVANSQFSGVLAPNAVKYAPFIHQEINTLYKNRSAYYSISSHPEGHIAAHTYGSKGYDFIRPYGGSMKLSHLDTLNKAWREKTADEAAPPIIDANLRFEKVVAPNTNVWINRTIENAVFNKAYSAGLKSLGVWFDWVNELDNSDIPE